MLRLTSALVAIATLSLTRADAACKDGNFLAAIGPNTALNASGTVYYGPTYQTLPSACDGNFVFSYNIYAEGLDTTQLWFNSPIQISACALLGGAGGSQFCQSGNSTTYCAPDQ